MPVRTSLAADSDSRRCLFQSIVKALNLFPSQDSWDLKWGEPFIALSQDRKIWVRVFYREASPLSAERLEAEVRRLSPHIPKEGRLLLCLPDIWARKLRSGFSVKKHQAQLWSYTELPGRGVAVEGPDAIQPESGLVLKESAPCSEAVGDEKLSFDEVRQLTEMGVEFKRYTLQKAGAIPLFTP